MQLPGVPNIEFKGGHMHLLYNDKGIKLLLDSIYNPEKVIPYSVNQPDPLTKVVDYQLVKESQAMKKAA